jgi:hypothetical protein
MRTTARWRQSWRGSTSKEIDAPGDDVANS